VDHIQINTAQILAQFHPIIEQWFAESFATPTPPQIQGWPAIFRGEHTLILAPTGSGKTLAAFLVCINRLLEQLLAGQDRYGVHTLYISPLKALNYDIERNLEQPLQGIMSNAREAGLQLPEIRKAVRTGDTTQKERTQMIQRPPHILITTPESLHLLLTSQQPREILRTVQFVIVDEIHAVSENKRGTFLSLLLERLQQLTGNSFQRIGLSATQKPLEEIAQFLGGWEKKTGENRIEYTPRPVTIIDAGIRKEMELQVVSPVKDFRSLPEDTIWPDIYQKLLQLIEGHRSTLIFTNNRAAAERITAELNERVGVELARAHHGSVSKEKRREIEDLLKAGKLPVLVATATLELGIDMGTIDLVCQVESPKSVARGLQRVGRAGHLYQAASKGRLIPKMRADLLEMAVVTRAMHQGDVAPIKIPRNCLDILAQQIIAMVAIQPWHIDELYHLLRQADAYHELPREHFIGVLDMLSGRYPADAFKDLKPRISWDRVNHKLYPLPGSQRLAIMSGGAIPDTGQYGCYLEDGFTKIGELEEEFIYERRLGEVFALGTHNWRIKKITHDRVIVSPAAGEPARIPFWKGEFTSRSVYLGQAFGQFCRELSQRLTSANCRQWLQQECDLDADAAVNLQQFFIDQQTAAGIIPNDQTILLEGFQDEMGEFRVVILSPWGGRLHLPWKLAILAQFRHQWGVEPESWHSDAGLVFRYTSENFNAIVDIIRSVTAQNVDELILEELANSSFFGLRFRHNANRAMLIPRPKPGKRAPLWLQRLRSRDLLEIARQYPSFPIVIETYRESLQDYLAINELKQLLSAIESNEVKIVIRRSSQPSPFTASLMFEFMSGYMYQYDEPKSRHQDADALDKDFLQQLLQPAAVPQLLDQQAILDVEQRLQAQKEGYQARTPTELAELLRRISDLTIDEIRSRTLHDSDLMLNELINSRRIIRVYIPGVEDPWRWINSDDFFLYRAAFANPSAPPEQPESYHYIFLDEQQRIPIAELFPAASFKEKIEQAAAQRKILERYLFQHTLVSLTQLLARYPLKTDMVETTLNELEQKGVLVKIASPQATEWIVKDTLERVRRVTLYLKRSKVQPCDTAQFAQFLFRWQHRTPKTAVTGHDGLLSLIEQFQGFSLAAPLLEDELFSRRMTDYHPSLLDESCSSGQVVWQGSAGTSGDMGNIAFMFREDFAYFQAQHHQENISADIRAAIVEAFKKRGACFINDLALETDLLPSAIHATLWEMVWSGEITNDTFAVIRAGKPAAIEHERMLTGARAYPQRPFRSAHRYRPLESRGRWSLLPTNDETAPNDSELVEILARQLLLRYGLLCREIYELEHWQTPWRTLYEKLVQLEWRGEIQRGYFVKGLSGLQFALPRAADELMAYSQGKKTGKIDDSEEQIILLNACDPANLYGAASPLPLLHPLKPDWRLLRHPNNYLILRNGIPLLTIEAKGARLTSLRDLSPDDLQTALHLLPQLLTDPAGWHRIRSIKVESWNDQPVRNSEIAAHLKTLGFRDEFKVLVLEKNF